MPFRAVGEFREQGSNWLIDLRGPLPFVAKFPDGVRVAVAGAFNIGVHRWSAAEEALSADFLASPIEGLSVSASDLISDLHGSLEYSAHLIKVMTERAVAAAS